MWQNQCLHCCPAGMLTFRIASGPRERVTRLEKSAFSCAKSEETILLPYENRSGWYPSLKSVWGLQLSVNIHPSASWCPRVKLARGLIGGLSSQVHYVVSSLLPVLILSSFLGMLNPSPNCLLWLIKTNHFKKISWGIISHISLGLTLFLNILQILCFSSTTAF